MNSRKIPLLSNDLSKLKKTRALIIVRSEGKSFDFFIEKVKIVSFFEEIDLSILFKDNSLT